MEMLKTFGNQIPWKMKFNLYLNPAITHLDCIFPVF